MTYVKRSAQGCTHSQKNSKSGRALSASFDFSFDSSLRWLPSPGNIQVCVVMETFKDWHT